MRTMRSKLVTYLSDDLRFSLSTWDCVHLAKSSPKPSPSCCSCGMAPRRKPCRHNNHTNTPYYTDDCMEPTTTMKKEETCGKRPRCRDGSPITEVASPPLHEYEPPSKRTHHQEVEIREVVPPSPNLVPVVPATPSTAISVPHCHDKESNHRHEPSQKIIELNNLAIGLYRKGDFQNASSLFQEAATMRRKAAIDAKGKGDGGRAAKLSSSQPTVSTYIYQRMDFDEGMNVFPDAMTVGIGDEAETIEAALLFNAGQARTRMEDLDNARTLYNAALECLLAAIAETPAVASALPLHERVIPVLHNLGHVSYRQGLIKNAMEFYERVLKHCDAVSAIDTSTVGLTYNCMGVLYYHMTEENAKARSYLESAEFILKDKLGPHSAQVATVLNNLGRVRVQKEDFQGAVKYYMQALEIREECLGTDHLDYAATAFNAGQSLHQLERYDEAIKLYNQFLNVATIKFSKQHRDIAVVLSGIAQIYQERKEYEKALKLYEESLAVGREALGLEHPDIAMLLNRLGNYYFEMDDFDEALKVYKEGLAIEQKVFEETHPNIIVTFSNIGEIYRHKGDFDQAIELYTRAMNLQRRRHGCNSPEVAGALNVIGLIYDQKGEYALALQFLQEALVIRRSVLGDDHVDVASTMSYLGTVFFKRNLICTAMELFCGSLDIRVAKTGCMDRDVAFTLYNIGLCHHSQHDYTAAITCFRKTLSIEESLLGTEHKDVALTLTKLGEACLEEDRQDEALEFLRRALRIENQSDERDCFAVARTYNLIGNVYLQKGEIGLMMDALVESGRLYRTTGFSLASVKVAPAVRILGLSLTSSAAAA